MNPTNLMVPFRKTLFLCIRLLYTQRSALYRCVVVVQLIFFLTAGSFFTGCGKKGPPQPPGQEPPPAAVKDLNKTITGDILILSWTFSGKKSALPETVAGYHVYRSKQRASDSECRSCPVLFERVAAIPLGISESGNPIPHRLNYRELLENGYRYTYKVVSYSNSGATGKESNTIDFTYHEKINIFQNERQR